MHRLPADDIPSRADARDCNLAAMLGWREHRDESAAAWLVNHLTPLMHGIALRSLPRPWMAEDAVQLAWIKLFRSLDTFDGRIPLSAWAVLLTKNECANLLRSWQRRAAISGADVTADQAADPETAGASPCVTDAVIAREDLTCVMHCIATLPELDRLIVRLLFMSNGSADDAAHETGLSAGAVRARVCRIRSALRASVAEKAA